MKLSLGFTLVLAVLAFCPESADAIPPAEGYGFDWLHPETARCQRASQVESLRHSNCQYCPDGNAFGLHYPYHKCQDQAGREYLIYKTPQQCTDAIETMKSNAP